MEGRSRTGALALVGGVFAAAWLILGAAGLVGTGNAVVAALGVVACAAVFGFGETMLSPVMPTLTNAADDPVAAPTPAHRQPAPRRDRAESWM
ncbi:hypothetical protein GA0070560_11056 [Micromonospora halophytica]|uniref:Uncharacterized protein n=2 Tax=Micromonospora halophytica TaxID=47864 RepID=A0A1C5IE98_9ACTN|nr:hypothetical protein GA0070560_11056 [Micromonospora halophytica]